MALLWIDSFDNIGTGTAYRAKYDSYFSTVGFTTGRNGNAMFSNQNNSNVVKNLPAKSTLYIGFATKLTINSLAGSSRTTILIFMDGATNQITLAINGAGNLLVYRQGTLLATGTTALSLNTFYYVEMKVVFHGSTGTVDVRINETSEIALTGQNTAPSGNNQATAVQIGCSAADGSTANCSIFYDDLYILDSSGSVNNNFLGDVKVECLLPNGNGTTSSWVNNSGNSTNNYTRVDENPPNDDTDYVQDGVNGDRDLYTLQDLASTAITVLGVQASNYSRKTDSGVKNAANTVRLSSTNYDSSSINVSDSYRYLTNIWELNPDTGVAWTAAQINALEAGVKVNS